MKNTFFQKDERFNGRMGFGGTSPCAQTKGDKVFIDKHPEDMLKDGDFAPKDIVFGANKHEGSFVLGGMISCIHYLNFNCTVKEGVL